MKVIAIAPVAGEGPLGKSLPRRIIERLDGSGIHAVDLQGADSVLAGAALGVETASNPRILAEIFDATAAEAVVFLTATPSWNAIDVQAIRTTSGDPILHATVRPRLEYFSTTDEAASAVVQALAQITVDRARVHAAAVMDLDEIPQP